MNCNANLPPIPCYIYNAYTLGAEGVTKAYLISVRALYGQAFQFTVLLETGALFTGVPASAICFSKETKPLPLSVCQMYDCVGSDIQFFVMETIRYALCTVKTFKGEIYSGKYLGTIDFTGESGLSRDPLNWKQMHLIQTNDGNLLIYPQYRIKIMDRALCSKCDEELPKYKANDIHWIIGE